MSRVHELAQLPGVWLGSELARMSTASIASGFPSLDRELPGGGWPTGALPEILLDRKGSGGVALLAPALAQVAGNGRWQAWIAPPHLPYGPALMQMGIDPARLIVIA